MPYDFELSFTGLCVFTFKGDKRTPEEVNALLVDTRHHQGRRGAHKSRPDPNHHLPYLSYDPRNLQRRPRPAHKLVPSPDSAQIALQDLTGKALEIILPEGVTRPLIAQWRPTAIPDLPPTPSGEDPAEEEWLDWAMSLQRMNPKNPKTPDPTDEAPYAGLKGDKVSARVRMTQGKLKAAGFRRQRGNNQIVIWDFKVPPNGAAVASHAMASSIALTLYNLPDRKPVTLRGRGFRVALRPFRLPNGNFEGVVRASVTNLPEIGLPEPLPDHLPHFAHFYDLVDFGVRKQHALRLPHERTATITSDNSYCPPTTHTKKE